MLEDDTPEAGFVFLLLYEKDSPFWEWILDLREQCIAKNIPFRFHQTGAKLLKDGKLYHIPRRYQHIQAHKANLDFRIGRDFVPETADASLWDDWGTSIVTCESPGT